MQKCKRKVKRILCNILLVRLFYFAKANKESCFTLSLRTIKGKKVNFVQKYLQQ